MLSEDKRYRSTLFGICCLILFSFLTLTVGAQSYDLSGTVTDGNGRPVLGAHAALANYQRATATGANGKFVLKDLKAGSYTLMVRMVGFQPFQKSITITDQPLKINVVLRDGLEDIQVIEIIAEGLKNPVDRIKELENFKTLFLGTSPNALKCTLVNPDVIHFARTGNTLRALASDFLEIENNAMGYRIKYLLKEFSYDEKSQLLSYNGFASFEPLEGDATKDIAWERTRKQAYNGSMQHFFTSLVNKKAKEEGYILHTVMTVPIVYTEKFLASVNTDIRKGPVTELPRLRAEVSDREVLPDTLLHTNASGRSYIDLQDDLLIIYTREKESEKYQIGVHWLKRPYKYALSQVSQLHVPDMKLSIDSDGLPGDLHKSTVYGYWAYEKVADLLPLDYEP